MIKPSYEIRYRELIRLLGNVVTLWDIDPGESPFKAGMKHCSDGLAKVVSAAGDDDAES